MTLWITIDKKPLVLYQKKKPWKNVALYYNNRNLIQLNTTVTVGLGTLGKKLWNFGGKKTMILYLKLLNFVLQWKNYVAMKKFVYYTFFC